MDFTDPKKIKLTANHAYLTTKKLINKYYKQATVILTLQSACALNTPSGLKSWFWFKCYNCTTSFKTAFNAYSPVVERNLNFTIFKHVFPFWKFNFHDDFHLILWARHFIVCSQRQRCGWCLAHHRQRRCGGVEGGQRTTSGKGRSSRGVRGRELGWRYSRCVLAKDKPFSRWNKSDRSVSLSLGWIKKMKLYNM